MTVAQSLPLFYSKPVAVDKKAHAAVSVTQDLGFAFAANVNAVPITLVEFADVVGHYPIVFSATSPATPLAILGLRQNENLFVDKKGQWRAGAYIPAYVRRYPFIFARNDEGDRLTLCIDDSKKILTKSKANPLFTPSGEATDLTQNALEFCRSYQAAADQTQAFCAVVEAADLLVTRHAEVRLPDQTAMTLTGFRQIDEEKLAACDADTIALWHKKNMLPALYAAAFSKANWQRLYAVMSSQSA